jgi:selenium-dependent xanthine dehydrogenase
MEFTLNGEKRNWTGDSEYQVLRYLREVEGITSPKDGCSSEGVCGCCTILLNSAPRLSCRMKMKDVAGKTITTIEGFDTHTQNSFADAFVTKGGVQCGFCTPGIVVRAKAIIDKNPSPTRAEIAQGLSGNICRCTGYKKVVDSIEEAARAIRDKNAVQKPQGTGRVGTRHPKYQAREAVLGQRIFVADMREPNMVHGAMRFSDHARAKIKSIDVSEAQKHPGVIRIFTAKDIPSQKIIGIIYRDWPFMLEVGDETRYVGDVLAGVVADTAANASAAAAKIKVDYEVLQPLTDMFEALKPNAPKLTPKGNILSLSELRVGDPDTALKNSKFVARRTFTTQRIEHAFLEPEACMAKPWKRDNKAGIQVFSQGQGAYEDRRQIAEILGLTEDLVDVVQVQNGGGFGGKEDLTVQGHASLFSWLLKQPVMVKLTRAESLMMHPKRHPFTMDYALGCNEQGELTALEANLTADSGAYASVGMKVVERAVAHSSGAYTVPHTHVKGTAVITNNIPCGAMRGFGVNQAAFAMEQLIDELCEMGGFDRWQFRYDNALREGKTTCTGQLMKSGVGVRACLEAIREPFRKAKIAGIAAGIKNTGIGCGMPDVGRARIDVISPTHIIINHGWTEMGQGVHTVALQTCVEETGINPEYIEVKVDTCEETPCGMTTASRGTSLVGNSVKVAAQKLGVDLKTKSLKDLVGNKYNGEWTCDWTTKVGADTHGKDVVTHYSYGYAAQMVELDDAGKITRVVAAHDAGKIMNPTLFEGQIEGAIHMGLGYAITEDFPLKDGKPVSTRFNDLGIIKAKDMPEIEVIGVEVTDPHGPYGAKGVGEIGLVPTAGAVANALYQFDKIRRCNLPLREMRLLGKKN